jgi:hypothetical protein
MGLWFILSSNPISSCLPQLRKVVRRFIIRLQDGKRQIQTMTTDPKQHASGEINYYAPSFLDRFMDFIERLPIPYMLTYLLLFIVLSMVIHVLAWADGWIPVYTSNPLLFLFRSGSGCLWRS